MKKWLTGVGVVVLCIFAVAMVFYLYGKIQLKRKIAELKAQGVPTTYAELEAKYKLPEGTPNAADVYMKAIAAYKPLADSEKQKMLPVMGEGQEPKDNEPYPADQMAAAAEFVVGNQEMYALLHEAGKVEGCNYPMDYSIGCCLKDNILTDIKHAAQSLSIAGLYYSYTKQPQKAHDVAMDNLRLGQSMCGNPGLISHLVQVAILAMGVSDIQEIVNRTSLEEIQLQQLQEYLQQISKSITIVPALSGEICFCLEYENIGRGETAAVLSADAQAGRYASGILMPYNSPKLIGAYQRMIEIDRLPVQEQLSKVREIIKKAMDANIFMYVPKMLLPSIGKIYEIHLRVRANVDCAITALAIERYRLKEKKMPETVEALVPGYLTQVYLDPFDGKPLRYKRTEPGYMVYTIGPDGVDDGGREREPNERGENPDWVFRVYR